jgi:hypothetical protein
MDTPDLVRCRRCGRALTTPAAVAAEYGSGCALQVLQEAAKATQEPATAGGEHAWAAR